MMTFLLYWRAQDPSGSYRLFAPLYYNSETPEEKINLFIPLHFSRRQKESAFSFWGPYFSVQSHGSQNQIFFPLYWLTQEEQSRSIYSPVFWSYKGSDTSRGFLPPYYWSHSPDARKEIGFPLYWHFWNKKETGSKDVQVAVPWFRYKTERSHFRTFFPIYWGRTKLDYGIKTSTVSAPARQEWNLLLPLFFQSKNPDGSRKIVTPLFSRFRDVEGREFGHSGLNFFLKDPWGGKTESFLPFFYYREEPDYFKFRFLLLSFKRHVHQEHSQTSLFPLFDYRRDQDRIRFLTPLFFVDRDPYSHRGFLLPYFWRVERDWQDPDGKEILRRHVFFPLFWKSQSEERKFLVAPPFFGDILAGQDRFTWVAPFYFRKKDGDDSLMVLPPLTFVRRESPERKWFSFLFLLWQHRKEERVTTTFFPIWRRSVFPGGSSYSLPGFYYLRDRQGVAGVVLNTFWDSRGETRYFIFFPTYLRLERPTWRVRSLFPLYRFQNQRFKENGFFPLWANTHSLGEPPSQLFLSRSHRFLPFYFYRGSDRISDLWLPPILARFTSELDEKKRETHSGRLFLVGAWEKTPDSVSHRFDPLYSYDRDQDSIGFTAPTTPFPLWKYIRKKSKSGKITREGAVFPYSWKESDTERKDTVIPLFYRSRERSEDGTKEVSRKLWFLIYYADKDQESSKKFLIPLYWRLEDKNRSLTVVPPLWMEREGDLKRQFLFPIWWRVQRSGEETRLLFPLYFRKESILKKEKTSILFPLFWSVREENRSFTSFAPLYLSHRKGDRGWKTLFPIYWSLETAGTQVRVVPPYFSITSQGGDTKTVGFAPLW
ncbi:MAG: hypothetical protein HY610_02140, partial [Elusimicrobia bacterium]|nr:hypothetical protein [Elusimicrobiota bacterium]